MNKKELKDKYDEILKNDFIQENNEKAILFGYKLKNSLDSNYNYYSKDFYEMNLKKELGSHYKEYKNGAGKELDEVNNKPPKFLSIASSSSFCFFSLRNNGFKYFANKIEKNNIKVIDKISFEKDLNIIPSMTFATAHLDAYFKTEQNEYFFECKCHEFFDSHKKSLSKSYFEKEQNLFVSDEKFKEWFTSEGEIIFGKNGIGINENSGFDFKQFCTHLMGIEKNRNKNLTSFLIYYYCLPKKELFINEPEIKEKIIQTINDTLRILNSEKLKTYFKDAIKFLFFVKFDGRSEKIASDKNTMTADEYLKYLGIKD